MKYRDNLKLTASQVAVEGGQGSWIVVRGEGPSGPTEAAIPRECLLQLAAMLKAMHGYLTEQSA